MPRPVFGRDGIVIPSQFGELLRLDEQWLSQEQPEAILDPELPVIDTHHHLWVWPGHRYLVPEFAADVGSGHNVAATVFAGRSAMYRADGPRPVGEMEFVVGQSAQSTSGMHGPARIAAAMFGYADPTLGAPVFESNHPVEKPGVSYRSLWSAFKRLCRSASQSGRTALLSGTAARVYGLPHGVAVA